MCENISLPRNVKTRPRDHKAILDLNQNLNIGLLLHSASYQHVVLHSFKYCIYVQS